MCMLENVLFICLPDLPRCRLLLHLLFVIPILQVIVVILSVDFELLILAVVIDGLVEHRLFALTDDHLRHSLVDIHRDDGLHAMNHVDQIAIVASRSRSLEETLHLL
jgi:hypothetical protein